MPKMIQIRNVPEKLHRTLKMRAARSGRSLSDFLLAELRRIAERPTLDEVWRRIQARGAVDADVSPADAVRAERERE